MIRRRPHTPGAGVEALIKALRKKAASAPAPAVAARPAAQVKGPKSKVRS